MMAMKSGVRNKRKRKVDHIDEIDSGCMVNKAERGAATFDVKRSRYNGGVMEWKAEGLKRKGHNETCEK